MVVAIALAATPAHADETRDKTPKARALELFEQSARAYREGRFQDAIDLLLEARRVKPEPVLLYNLGRAYEAIGKPTEAADAYAAYLAEDPRAEDRLAIEGRIATLRAQAVQLDKAKNAAAAERRPPPEAEAEPESGPPTIAPWIITGVGVVGLGTGVAFALVAGSRHSAAAGEPRQVEAQQKQDQAKTFATGATIAFVAGGVVTAAGLTWLGIRAFAPSRRVALIPGLGAMTMQGTF